MSPTNTITSSGISEGEEDIEDDIPLDKCVFCSIGIHRVLLALTS